LKLLRLIGKIEQLSYRNPLLNIQYAKIYAKFHYASKISYFVNKIKFVCKVYLFV